jgi:molybdopterin-guanine dinucleotide biosynthesis protein A
VETVASRVTILAGGAGSRMGAPKAGLNLAGRAMIEYAIEAAEAAALVPVVVSRPGTELPSLPCAVLEEGDGPRHPLAGVIAALERFGEPLVALACDLPLIPPALLARLASETAPFVMPAYPRPQPLAARYAPEVLPTLRRALADEASMTAVAEELGGTRLEEDELRGLGDPDWMFANANDRADLAAIEAEIERRRQAA